MSGSSTLASAVVRGMRLKLWKTNPILRLRTSAAVVVLQAERVGAVEPEAPGRGLVEEADDVHERALAAARAAHDGDVVAPVDHEVDPVEGADLGGAVSYTFVTARRAMTGTGQLSARVHRRRATPRAAPGAAAAEPPRLPVVPVPAVAGWCVWSTSTSPTATPLVTWLVLLPFTPIWTA